MPYPGQVRLVVARCSVDYAGRLSAHLPLATRLLIVKADGSVLVHSDGGSYKPLNWMSPPCTLRVSTRTAEEAQVEELPEQQWIEQWDVTHDKSGDTLRVLLFEVLSDSQHDLGIDPGLQKDGVEAHLQELLAANIETLGEGYSLVRREYGTAIGPVDILARDGAGASVAIEIKRRGEIDGVEQLTRYLDQIIRPQAKVLATDRGIDCVTLDYEALRGIDDSEMRLF
jgi:RecB family endonuclease NucS